MRKGVQVIQNEWLKMKGPLQPHHEFEFGQNGLFIDPYGGPCAMFGVVEFQEFWNTMDAVYESPLGRKLIYAAADAEERLLRRHPDFQFGRWFGKNRVVGRLNARWASMGWGLFLESQIRSPVHDALTVGFALAHREHLDQQRYELGWQQVHTEEIRLELRPKEHATMVEVQAAPPLDGEWLQPAVSVTENLELEPRKVGFFLGQERSFFLPTHVLGYLSKELNGRPIAALQDFTLQSEFSDGHDVFLSMAHAMKVAFDRSDFPVYLRTSSDWQGILYERIQLRGWGSVIVLESILDDNAATVFQIVSPIPALVTGTLIGMWQRGHGFRANVKFRFEEGKTILSMEKQTVDYEVKS